MQDFLGVCDDLQGLRECLWIGRFVAQIDQLRLGCQATSHDLLR
jgi:hypothetical protein